MSKNLKNRKTKKSASLLLGICMGMGSLGMPSLNAAGDDVQGRKLSIKEKCALFEQKSNQKENESLPKIQLDVKKIDKKILETAEKNIPLQKPLQKKINKSEALSAAQINNLFPIDNNIYDYYLNLLRGQSKTFTNTSDSSTITVSNNFSSEDNSSESSYIAELNKKLGIEKNEKAKEKTILISDRELSYLSSLDPSLREIELNQILKNREQEFGIVHNSSAKTEKAFITSLKLIYDLVLTESNSGLKKLVSALPAMCTYFSEIGENTEFNHYAGEFFNTLLKNVKNYLYTIEFKKENISVDFESKFKRSFTIESMKDYPGADKSNSLKSSIKNIEVLGKIIPKCHYDIKIKSAVTKVIKQNAITPLTENK